MKNSMKAKPEKKKKNVDIALVIATIVISLATVIYGVFKFGLNDGYSWLGLLMSGCYLWCVILIGMFVFNKHITYNQFNYWCSLGVGFSVLLRDILFPTELEFYSIELSCRALSVLLLCMLTYFYARKEWKTYTKWNLWMICIVDTAIAILYNLDIYLEPENQYTEFFLADIWIRPTITYGMVTCFVAESRIPESD